MEWNEIDIKKIPKERVLVINSYGWIDIAEVKYDFLDGLIGINEAGILRQLTHWMELPEKIEE